MSGWATAWVRSGAAALQLVLLTNCAMHPPTGSPPNLVIILTDDQGFGDLGCYGAEGFATPHLDQLAADGLRLTAGYVPATVCTPSRAALLTGCYPKRVGLHEAVLFPYSEHGLSVREQTIADRASAAGYRTACIGKWHLGHHPEFLPTQQGFDRFFGVPYSNDMDGHLYRHNGFQAPPLPLYDDQRVIEEGPDQRELTQRFTTAAVQFLESCGDQPFFLYLAHVMPHRPLHASSSFQGSSQLGLYGDVMQEIDASTGKILATLDHLGVADNTLVVFLSDNGPVLRDHRGSSAGPLRGHKATTWEGGCRVPFLLRWPQVIPPGTTSDELFCSIDLLPTFAAAANWPTTTLPIDGKCQLQFLDAPLEVPSAREELVYYSRNGHPEAIRNRRFKLHVAKSRGWRREQGAFPPMLFDLLEDPGEQRNLSTTHASIVEALRTRLWAVDAELATTARAPGRVPDQHPSDDPTKR